MKYLAILLISTFFLSGCVKEEYGNVRQQIKATTDGSVKKSKSFKMDFESRYSQFGDFIASITPTRFVGELHVVRFVSDTVGDYDMLTLVMRQPHEGDELVMADFSNNAVIPVVPEVSGVNTIVYNPDGQGAFFKEEVTMKLLWVRMGITQDIELPSGYTNVELAQFNSSNSQRTGNKLTTGMLPLNHVVNGLSMFGSSMEFYFGMTDNTSIKYDKMLGNNVETNHIRSSHFSQWSMTPPLPEQTKTYITTIGFINDDIIQIYAGTDNIPYTSDDIIVYEPNFWERIYVNVTEN